MSRLSKLWAYWRKNIETARREFSMMVLVATIVLALASALFSALSIQSPIQSLITNTQAAQWCKVGAIAVISIWGLLWLPFKRHEAQEKAHLEEKQKLALDYAERGKALKSQIESQKLRLDDRAEQKQIAKQMEVIKNNIGQLLIELETKGNDLRAIVKYKYDGELRSAFESGVYKTIDNIIKYLDVNLNRAEE